MRSYHGLLCVLCSCLVALSVGGQTPPSGPSLNLESRTTAWDLTVGVLPDPGALFIYTAPDLPALVNSPTLLLQTNTPLLEPLVVPVLPTSGGSSATFFSALFWPNRSVDEFGDPEYHDDEPPPAMVLFSSDLPPDLGGGQTFTVDFYVGDPTGESLDVSGTAGILVVRETDGMVHPDATVVPPTGQMISGVMRVEIAVKATSSVAGYTLGLRIAPGLVKRVGLHASDTFLKIAFGLGPAPLTPPQRTYLKAKLEQRRQDNIDEGPSWSVPLAGGAPSVSGTFGEWRGRDNNNVHRGVDFAAPAASTLTPSRAGVVSHRDTITGKGDYLVVDHGRGWFSRYLHLDADKIVVHVGQGVSRTTPLTTGLYAVGNWPRHLHFEVRHGTDQAAWGDRQPGSAQDPLQTPDMFAVAAGTALPRVEEFGLTRQHPGTGLFVKASPTATDNGTVYVFGKLLDLDGGHRLGLRSMSMQAELASTLIEIHPRDDAEIARLLPPGAYTDRGFALYSGDHAAQPDRVNYYRYWWRWDTSAYARDRMGPRHIVLTGVDHNPSPNEFRFFFGPEVVSGQVTETGARQYQFTLRAHLGTNTPAALGNAALLVQPDQYKLAIVRTTGGQPVEGVAWKEGKTVLTGSTPFSRPYSAHRDEQGYAFTLPDAETGSSLRLRVSSRTAPDLTHEVLLSGCSGCDPSAGPPAGFTPGANMAWIPCGTFAMGDSFGDGYPDEQPVHTVTVSGFYMDRTEVTETLWDEVYQWAVSNGYQFERIGGMYGSKGPTHPVHRMSWYDVVKWCNARSEREGRVPAYYTSAAQTTVYRTGRVDVENGWVEWDAGYRLPTEAEWEYAARGGLRERRFPWGDTISHSQANYYSFTGIESISHPYDVSPTRGFHPTYATGIWPHTSPVGSFDANGYGLYDMAGNVWEWCWDWYGGYSSSPLCDPRGPVLPSLWDRVLRGSGWDLNGTHCRVAARLRYMPFHGADEFGFRSVLPPSQP